jgi:hypothetical protein
MVVTTAYKEFIVRILWASECGQNIKNLLIKFLFCKDDLQLYVYVLFFC